MAKTSVHAIGSWDTFHNNGPFATTRLYKTTPESRTAMPDVFTRLNDSAKEIQRLIALAAANNETFRAYGSAWSMSHIAHGKDNMHFNADMNIKLSVDVLDMHALSPYEPGSLFFFQCGNVIKEISKYLFEHGRSLKATGASNGQTIAGCISTGVHGSAYNFGGVQDAVVGIQFLTGPGASDIVYIERHSRPAVSDAFAAKLNAKVIRNDGLFNAALVSLGAFGFIYAVVLETEPVFLLNRYVKKISKEKALELATTLAFEESDFTITGETGTDGKPLRPFHYKVFVNPYTDDNEYVMEVMYKKPYRDNYPDPIPGIKTAVYRDLIILFTKIAERYKDSIPKLIKLLQRSVLPPVDLQLTGTIGEIFWDAPYQGPAFACSVGVDHTNAATTLGLLAKLAREEGPIPGIYAMRFVKQSRATLAFTQFPVTCVVEIDGLLWKPKNNSMISLEQFNTRIIDTLKNNGIPFTIHWGKNADWKYPGLVQTMYGNKAQTWMDYRSALLGPEMAAVFSNNFLQDVNLHHYSTNASPDLIKSLL